ncbi:MAG TPA: peptidoglycan DD-metalloendopeptidase family protein [Elusimicrobiales bacterium]|mgnify:CR=1 FL=1|nr:peptidoglycan DD-metalloendopeptidase family protein [Elusimicrobiales bacterium]
MRYTFERGGERPRWRWLAGFFAAACLFAAVLFFLAGREGSRPPPNKKMFRVAAGAFSGPLDAVLKAEGLGDAARNGISRSLSKTLNLRRLRPADTYSVVFSTSGALKYLVINKDLNNYLLFPSAGGKFSLSVRPVEIKAASSAARGTIKSSLWESMTEGGVPPAVILDYTDVFSWSVDFLTEVRDGDRWALAWDYKSDASGKVIAPKITAGLYDGAETGRKTAAEHQGAYYDEKGESLRSLFLRAPLHYRRISSYFTKRRFHPVLKYFRPHLGIDYAAPSGTPVSAVADGTVSFAAWKGGNGRLIILRHAAGYESTYGHLSRFAKGLRAGRRVNQGDVIGYVGSSGLSSGPHLDFRVKQGGKPLNFLKIKYRSSGGVSGKAREAVAAAIKTLSK